MPPPYGDRLRPILEHHTEGDRDVLQRATVALNLIVPGLDECVEPAQWHADSAASIPAEMIVSCARTAAE